MVRLQQYAVDAEGRACVPKDSILLDLVDGGKVVLVEEPEIITEWVWRQFVTCEIGSIVSGCFVKTIGRRVVYELRK